MVPRAATLSAMLLLWVGLCNGHATGADDEACKDLYPSHGYKAKSAAEGYAEGYRLVQDKVDYKPNDIITVCSREATSLGRHAVTGVSRRSGRQAGATDDVEVHAIQLLGSMVTEATQEKLAEETARDGYVQSSISSLSAGQPLQEVEKLTDTSARTTIAAVSSMFARYGIPLEVCTDNGPQFSSHEFSAFSKRYDFKHVTSNPHYPQSNGLTEKGVQIVKRILKKTEESRDDFWLGLLVYRPSPLEDGRFPGELLQGRRLRTNIPDLGEVTATTVKKRVQIRKGQPLPPLAQGDVVRIRDTTWSRKAKVVDTAAPRSYRVLTEDHRMLRRNRQHLLHTRERYAEASDDDDGSTPGPDENGTELPVQTESTPSNEATSQIQETPNGGAAPTANRNLATGTTTQPLAPSRQQQPSGDGGSGSQARKSARTVKPPERLHYDSDFHQVA